MKEALIELTTTLVQSGINPKTHQFYPSQALIGYYPYHVVILTDMVETMRASPTSVAACASSATSTSLMTSSASPVGIRSSHSAQAPLCSSVPFPSHPFPPPISQKTPIVNPSQVLVREDHQVLGKILTAVEKIFCILERTDSIGIQNNYQSDSESEYFSGYSSSSEASSLSSGPSQSSSSNSNSSRSSNFWSKSKLREERICIKFQHGSCSFDDWHSSNAHLCAKCYLSFDELLETGHGADWCPNF